MALCALLIDQDSLLPWAWRFIGAVNAANPTAGAFLALQQFFAGSLNAALACFWLFRIIHPTDELVPAERRQAFPQHKDLRVRAQGGLKIFTCLVNSAVWECTHHTTFSLRIFR